MFISSHENEHSISNKAQRLAYRQLRYCTKRRLRDTRSLADYPLLSRRPHFSEHLTIVNFRIFSATYHFYILHIFLGPMMIIDHDEFFPAVVMMSHIPCHVNIRRQYNCTHYNDNAQHGARYNSTERTTLPLPGKSQCTHLSTINVHNNRPIDSAHFAQPMSHNSTYTSLSLALVCSDRPADSTRIVSLSVDSALELECRHSRQ